LPPALAGGLLEIRRGFSQIRRKKSIILFALAQIGLKPSGIFIFYRNSAKACAHNLQTSG
jgi:hypothetical protein